MEGQVELKKDLMTLEPEEFYFKHIVKSRNWYFSEYLHIPPEEIVDKMDTDDKGGSRHEKECETYSGI